MARFHKKLPCYDEKVIKITSLKNESVRPTSKEKKHDDRGGLPSDSFSKYVKSAPIKANPLKGGDAKRWVLGSNRNDDCQATE